MKTALRMSALVLLFAASCTGGPHLLNISQMTLPLEAGARFNGNTPLAGRVALGSVTALADRDLMGSATSDRIAEFGEALKRSLEDAQLAALAAPGFTLHAVVTRADADPSGGTFTAGVTYTLAPVRGGMPVVQKAIITTATAQKGDPAPGGLPQDLARNGAFRANIEQAIEALYGVKLR